MIPPQGPTLPKSPPADNPNNGKSRKGGPRSILATLAPGLLIAATGVGAGDLATAGLAGVKLGTAVLWAVVLGAFFKFVINEGLMRWQLATGETLLEGVLRRYGRIASALFLPYLLVWSLLVGCAIMGACGVALHALCPVFDDPARGKLIFGALHSAIGLAIVWRGGFPLFERIMGICVAVMFSTVVITALQLRPDLGAVARGLLLFEIPENGRDWTIALIGGVGGTLTILCYGYWIREHGRQGVEYLRVCRIDLAVGYLVTAFFGIALIIIASPVVLSQESKGVDLLIRLGDNLRTQLGATAQWAFLLGAWCAIFSSLLGVWQSVPYMFADFVRVVRSPRGTEAPPLDTRGKPYRCFLIGLATLPALGLLFPFAQVQKTTGIVGALSIPLLGFPILLLNRRHECGKLRNHPVTSLVLVAILGFFLWILAEKLGWI